MAKEGIDDNAIIRQSTNAASLLKKTEHENVYGICTPNERDTEIVRESEREQSEYNGENVRV